MERPAMLIQLLFPLTMFAYGTIAVTECFFSRPWPLLVTGFAFFWLYSISHQWWKTPLKPLWWQLIFLVFLVFLDSIKLTRHNISVISMCLGSLVLVFHCFQELVLRLLACLPFYLGGSQKQLKRSSDILTILELPLFFTSNGLVMMASESFIFQGCVMRKLIGGFLMSAVGEITFYFFSHNNYYSLDWFRLPLWLQQDRKTADFESVEVPLNPQPV